MIVKNESSLLSRCLESIKDIADEIIIADTGSEDDTKEKARLYTDKIYDFPWVDDFSAARNFAFSKASKDYIMWLDADDILTEESVKLLKKFKTAADCSADMIMMPYQAAFDEGGRCTFSYYRERLMKREAGFVWEGAVHEAIAPRGNTVYLDIPVEHRPEHKESSERNIKIYEKLLAQKGTLNARECYYYARELKEHGRIKEALRRLEEFSKRDDGWLEDKKCACLLLAECYEKLKDDKNRLSRLLKALEYGRPQASLCCELGRCYADKGLFDTASFWFESALNSPRARDGFVNEDDCGFTPSLWLCVCCDRLGEYDKALSWHLKAKEYRPSHPAVLHNDKYFFGD